MKIKAFGRTPEWRAIPSLKNKYEVSSAGEIRNSKTGKRISPGTTSNGYFFFCPWIDGKQQSYPRVHQCVAEAFIGPCPAGLEVNHIDGNKKNNRIENLEYVTHSENMIHSFTIDLGRNRGANNPRAKLNPADVSEIREIYGNGWFSQREIMRIYGVGKTTIAHIVRGENWKHVGAET